MNIYKGFSFFKYGYDKSIILTDIDLVKTDLINHIFTRRGERVKMPNFGTAIPDLIFQPLTNDLLDLIEEDLTTVFNYDPRVELISLQVIPLYNRQTVIASANLRYIELDITDRLDLKLEFQG